MIDHPETGKSLGEFVLLEMLGHRVRVGRLSETTIAGVGFLRLDPILDGETPMLVNPASVYAITPLDDEAFAKQIAFQRRPPSLLLGAVQFDEWDDGWEGEQS